MAVIYLSEVVSQFCRDLQSRVHGDSSKSTGLISASREVYAQFKRDILGTTPILLPYEDADGHAGTVIPSCLIEVNGKPPGTHRAVYLKDIRGYIQSYAAQELPRHVLLHQAKKLVFADIQTSWESSSLLCLKGAHETLSTSVENIAHEYLGKCSHLGPKVKSLAHAFLRTVHEDALRSVLQQVKMETTIPYTQNTSDYLRAVEKYHAYFSSVQASITIPSVIQTDVLDSKSDADDLRHHDEFGTEIEVMAEVRAYFEISSSRFVDIIPMIIHSTFLCTFVDHLEDFLVKGLAVEELTQKFFF